LTYYFRSTNAEGQIPLEEEKKEYESKEEKEEVKQQETILYQEEDEDAADVSFAEHPNSLIQNFQNLIIGLGRGDYDEPIDTDPMERQYCSIFIEKRGWVIIFFQLSLIIYIIYIYRFQSTKGNKQIRFLQFQLMEILYQFHIVKHEIFK
jgi:hypothetical protein